MMDDRALRIADPAAGWQPDPDSAEARAMLATILDAPRDCDTTGVRGGAVLAHRRRTRRLVIASAAVVAAAAAGAVVPGLWDSGPGGATAAYAVTPKADGSVEVTVRWDQLTRVDGLAAALRKAGVETVVGTDAPSGECGTSAEREQAAAAFNNLPSSDGYPPSMDGYVIRPKLFPVNSTVVVAAVNDSARKLNWVLMYLASKNNISCSIGAVLGSARYTGPTPYPTRIEFPVPQATS